MLNNHRQHPVRPFDPSLSLSVNRSCHCWKLDWTIQLASLLHFLSFSRLRSSIWHWVPMFMHLLRLLPGLSEKKEGLFFSPFLSFFLCNLLPSETINAHSTSTSRHSFDVYSGSRPLSFSTACCSFCLSSSLYPLLSLPLPLAHSLRLLYNQIIKWIVNKMILPGN